MQTRWEYKLMEFSDRFLDADRLTILGKEGWHLCVVSLDKYMRRYYFKRPVGVWDKSILTKTDARKIERLLKSITNEEFLISEGENG